MGRVGLITYHSAYNFGSVLQAYATQEKLKDLGVKANVINYRMKEQKYFYETFYRTGYGLRNFLIDLTMLPVSKERAARQKAFESFLTRYMNLTEEVSEPEEVAELWTAYETVVSGSDQIWSKHSLELEHNDRAHMDPYLLKGYEGRKISYASSVGRMTTEDLKKIVPELKRFHALSFREKVTCNQMAEMLERPVEHVADPTLLLTKEQWISKLGLKKTNEEKYILAYSLGGPRTAMKLIRVLRKMSKKQDCKVKLIMPFCLVPGAGRRIEWHPEYGPVEFLNALYNAETVVTDSYHGTVFSVNFGKEFYSLCKPAGANFRKTDILEQLGLSSRVVYEPDKILERDFKPIDYAAVNEKLSPLRRHSEDYLKTALKEPAPKEIEAEC